MNKIVFYAFILAVITLFAVYYKGLTTDISTASPFVLSLVQSLQGRNPQTGNFSPYAQ